MCNLKILIVEDDPIQACAVDKLTGYFCKNTNVIVSTKKSAIDLLQTESFDGAIIDLVLPDGCGYEVAEVCKQLKVPLVFCTSSNDEHNINTMYEYGWVLSKPARMKAIDQTVAYFKLSKAVKDCGCKYE